MRIQRAPQPGRPVDALLVAAGLALAVVAMSCDGSTAVDDGDDDVAVTSDTEAIATDAGGDDGPGDAAAGDKDVTGSTEDGAGGSPTPDDAGGTRGAGLDGGADDAGGAEDAGGADDSTNVQDSAEPADDPCDPTDCFIDDVCYANFEVSPDDVCLQCVVGADRLAWTGLDAEPCDDGSACTTGDTCWDGTCIGVSKSCDDGDPCTISNCDPLTGTCTTESQSGPCDDGDPCTANDECQGGLCLAGPAASCDDGNGCTLDTCLAMVGCLHQDQADAACDDGDACTTADTCIGGACVGGTALGCDDGSLCTVDACDPAKGCVHSDISHVCTDDNPCTDEACDPDDGCVFPPNTEPCDDGSACTAGDTCSNGGCVGALVPFDDGNPCTDDSCDPAMGPVHLDNTLPCDDGDACTLGDQCGSGSCQTGPNTPNCGDDNVCTDDSCDPANGCVNTPNAVACDDDSNCTVDDVCAASECAGTPLDCDDGNACTADVCKEDELCTNSLTISNDCRPVIDITNPPRAATLTGTTAPLMIQGSVTSGAGPITSFTLNGQPVPLAPGATTFAFPYFPDAGGNTLVFEAMDAMGTPRKRVQAFHWAQSYIDPVPPDGMASPGMGIWLSQEVIDDGDHSLPPDDLATIFEAILDDFDLNAIAGGKLTTIDLGVADYDIYLNNLTDTGRSVSLQAQTGLLKLTATISGVVGAVSATTPAWWAPNFDGTINISSIVVQGDVKLTVVNHQLVASAENINVTINGLSFAFNNSIADFLLGWLTDFILGAFVEDLESSFESEFAAVLEPMLADSLNSLAFATSFDLPSFDPAGESVTIDLVTDFDSVAVAPTGADIKLRAGVFPQAVKTPWDNAGSARRAGCGTGLQQMLMPKASPFELGFADDTFNLLLYAAWQGGLLEFDVPPEMLADVSLEEFNITDLDIALSGMLAPVLSDCADGELLVHIGDLRVDATMNVIGAQMTVVMFASFTANVSLSADNGEIGLAIEEIVELNSEVTVVEDALIGSEALIAGLINDNLVPALLGALGGGALGGFPIPEVELTEGAAITISPDIVERAGGNSFIGGSLQ